jgi:hypothetical protein
MQTSITTGTPKCSQSQLIDQIRLWSAEEVVRITQLCLTILAHFRNYLFHPRFSPIPSVQLKSDDYVHYVKVDEIFCRQSSANNINFDFAKESTDGAPVLQPSDPFYSLLRLYPTNPAEKQDFEKAYQLFQVIPKKFSMLTLDQHCNIEMLKGRIGFTRLSVFEHQVESRIVDAMLEKLGKKAVPSSGRKSQSSFSSPPSSAAAQQNRSSSKRGRPRKTKPIANTDSASDSHSDQASEESQQEELQQRRSVRLDRKKKVKIVGSSEGSTACQEEEANLSIAQQEDGLSEAQEQQKRLEPTNMDIFVSEDHNHYYFEEEGSVEDKCKSFDGSTIGRNILPELQSPLLPRGLLQRSAATRETFVEADADDYLASNTDLVSTGEIECTTAASACDDNWTDEALYRKTCSQLVDNIVRLYRRTRKANRAESIRYLSILPSGSTSSSSSAAAMPFRENQLISRLLGELGHLDQIDREDWRLAHFSNQST